MGETTQEVEREFSPTTIIEQASDIREAMKAEEAGLRGYVDFIKQTEEVEGFHKGECIAQAMLALRAFEEARMRIGKVIQYADGGESIYDKK